MMFSRLSQTVGSPFRASTGVRKASSIVPGPKIDKRTPLVIAYQWVSQITTVSLEMSLPAWLGYLGDERWGTSPWLVAVGAVLGFVVGMRHLLQMTQRADSAKTRKPLNRDQQDSGNGDC